ncbi:MAG: undecaprenyl-phosphate glucose phosphotransferase [Chitinophagaceae bacterium]
MKKKTRLANLTRYGLDVAAILLAWFLSVGIHFPSLGFFGGNGATFCLISASLWIVLSFFSNLYANRRSNKFSEEIVFILYHLLLFAVALSSILFFLQIRQYDFSFFTIYVCYLFMIAAIVKYLHRKSTHSALFHGKQYDKILLVGATDSAWNFYETINKYYYYGYQCVGFLDDQKEASLNGCPYWGSVPQLKEVLNRQPIDEVVIALPNTEHRHIQKCIETCDYLRVPVRILPDFQQYTASKVEMNNIGILPVLNVSKLPLDRVEFRVIKRMFDIVFTLVFFATAGLILFPLIAFLLKITTRGPVFYKQERWGLNNAKITCYKFRTMDKTSTETDDEGNYQQTVKDDPRVTRVGAFLRKTNLDEIPQFYNVLLGNMSVVGPRPHPTPLNLESMHTVDNYMLRHIVLPGITGWAQVNGLRGEIRKKSDMQKRVDFDLYYIHRWTFWLDCQIVLQTIINFIRGDQNAY